MKYRIIVAAIVLLSHTSLFPHSDPFPIKSLQEGFLTSGTAISDFRRVTPFDSVDCPLQNYVQLGNDGKQLHLHWIAEINEKSSTGIYTAPDTWSGADYLRLQIITDVKNYYSYCYYFFPLGNLYDAIRRPDFIIDESWNSNYSYTSSTDDNQWIIEAVIPYSDLRFFGSPPYHWKIILTRYFKASDETYSVPVVHTRLGKDYFRKALPVVIKEKIRGAKPLFIRPYALTTYDRQRQEFIFKEDDVGIDISCWLSQATDVKFSFKPDFSDIPLDDELDIYNLKFAPSYDENRYFFIEDMDVFGLDYNTFYSRHVLQPEYGFKIISNNDRFSWGILSTKESSDEVDHRDFFNILACNPTSEFYSLPVIILNRTDGKYHNDVLIFSPDCEIAKNHFLKLDLRLSTLHDSASDHVGYNFEIGYNLLSRYLNLTLETRHMSRDFRLDMGRIYEDDFYGWTAKIERNIEFNNRFLREIRSSLWLNEEIDNSSNDLLERFMFSELELELQKKVSFLVEYQYVRELFQDKYY
ncbi:MAG: hypothetical protein JXB60_00805, partial [Candidatus Cloacimonetes bacterium]|nr:hypothetical protein [Candidatus Cloacimonadota bacterium]